MDKNFLKKKGLLEDVNRFNTIMEYIGGTGNVEEVDANADGLDDMTGMVDPNAGAMGGGAMGVQDPAMGGVAPAPATGAMPATDPNATQGVPGFDPQGGNTDTDPAATAEQSFSEAKPEDNQQQEDEEVIDVDELVNGQKKNEEAINKLTDKFEKFIEKFGEFEEQLKSNAEFIENVEKEIEKRNPTSVERLTMRSLQSKPFGETPEEYMENNAPENYSPEDDNNGVGEPRYTITRDDIRNATDYASIAKTLRDNENATLNSLLGF